LRAFANLLDRLAFTPARNGKLTLLRDYFREAPDPERGWALASLTGALGFEAAKPSFIRKAVEARMDP
jgi:DNA ligase-1